MPEFKLLKLKQAVLACFSFKTVFHSILEPGNLWSGLVAKEEKT